jgi:hypothetical protein
MKPLKSANVVMGEDGLLLATFLMFYVATHNCSSNGEGEA